MKYVIIIVILIIFILWMISVRRRLVAMNENIDIAMAQIGVQMASRVNALRNLLVLMREYGIKEADVLNAGLANSNITSASLPEDVAAEEALIAETLEKVTALAEQYPALKSDEKYSQCMYAVVSYGKMVGTSSMIYNDSVARLNKALRFLPVALVGNVFGCRPRQYFSLAE